MTDKASMSSAAHVYRKYVPLPVRSAAAHRVPPRVRRGVQRKLARTLAERESRKHRRALKQVREAGPGPLPERRTAAADGRVGHVHRGLTADVARRLDHELVTTALDAAGIPWFAVPALDDRRLAVAVPREHKPAVRRVLRALLEEHTGYVVSVSPANASTARTPGSHVKAWKHYGKTRVIRVTWLRTDPTESLWFGEDQGVEIEFWTVDKALSGPRLVGPRPNRVQRVVPLEIDPVEVSLDRLTGYADIGTDGESTVIHADFDVPRLEEVLFPVDAVVLWQHDEPWAEELLRATLRSLHQYAPWIDVVHLVAQAPIPAWVRIEDRISTTVAGPDAELRLHELPDLADRFLLFRPGAALARPVRPFDFFTPLGSTRPRRRPLTARDSAAPWTGLAYSLSGRAVAHGFADGPQPYTRAALQSLTRAYDLSGYLLQGQYLPELTGTHPLDGLVHHTAHCGGRAEPSGEATFALHAALPGVGQWLERLLVRRDAQQFHFLGLGAGQAWENGGTKAVLDFLPRYFPVPSPYEHGTEGDGPQ
ncbi:sugar phosphotransferase [Streptomyces sp. NPDC002536]